MQDIVFCAREDARVWRSDPCLPEFPVSIRGSAKGNAKLREPFPDEKHALYPLKKLTSEVKPGGQVELGLEKGNRKEALHGGPCEQRPNLLEDRKSTAQRGMARIGSWEVRAEMYMAVRRPEQTEEAFKCEA